MTKRRIAPSRAPDSRGKPAPRLPSFEELAGTVEGLEYGALESSSKLSGLEDGLEDLARRVEAVEALLTRVVRAVRRMRRHG